MRIMLPSLLLTSFAKKITGIFSSNHTAVGVTKKNVSAPCYCHAELVEVDLAEVKLAEVSTTNNSTHNINDVKQCDASFSFIAAGVRGNLFIKQKLFTEQL